MSGLPFFEILQQVLVLFVLILIGLFAVRWKVLPQAAVQGLVSLVLKITLPAMILDSMIHQNFSPAVLAQSGTIVLVSFAVYAALILLSLPLGAWLNSPPQDRGVYRFVLSFSNVGFMGFPIVGAVFGKEALFYTALYNLPFNLLTFTLGVWMLLRGHDREGAPALWKELANPVVLSILAGFVLFVTGVQPPALVGRIFELTGSVTTPLSMLLVGALLAQHPVKSALGEPRLYLVAGLRLLVWPAAVFFVLRLFTSDPWLVGIPTLITAMPAAANTALLASAHGANANLASRAVFFTTLLSIFTLPLVVWLLQSAP